jgi:DNA helicase-2/ATP-dependent DNA helicase PcrA
MINETRLRDHDNFSDFAILYRTNAQSRILEEALRKKNIPYKIYGGLSFYQRKEVKDLLAYFRLIINPQDDEAFKRIVNYPKRGIGNTSLSKLTEFAGQNNLSIWQAAAKLTSTDIGLGKAVIKKFHEFMSLVSNFTAMLVTGDAYEIARQIAVSTGILRDLHADKTPEGISRHENVQELLNGIKEFTNTENENGKPNLLEYIENVSLLTNDDKTNDGNNDKAVLMTIHSAKGLEFKHVFLAGLEEDLFPSKFTSTNLSELEEERRLFYVAITRAEKSLSISYAKTRYRWGQLANCMPSRFIRDINPEFIEMENQLVRIKGERTKTRFGTASPSEYGKRTEKPYSSFKKIQETKPILKPGLKRVLNSPSVKPVTESKSNANNIKEGSTVEHQRFGQGRVLKIEGDFQNIKATIEFKTSGTKQLLLKFAKLKVLEN